MKEDFTKHISEEITDKIKEFVNDGVFGDREYLFIEKINGTNHGHCTKCHSEYWLSENYKHNATGICPECGAKLQVKHTGYGRKNCTNDACFYFFEKSVIDPKVIVCKGYYVERDYTKSYKTPETTYLLEAIYLFGDKISKMLKLNYSNYYGGRWSEKKSVFDFNQGWLAPKECHISRESVREATKNTRFQYIPKELLQGHYSTVKVFDEFAKYAWLEQLCKIGFENIIESRLMGHNLFNCLNYKGKDLFKILKLSRKDVRDIVRSEVNISPRVLRFYQLQVKDKSALTPEEVSDFDMRYGYIFDKVKNILKYTSMRKAFKYMEKQNIKYKQYYSTPGKIAITWSDYIDNCLDLDMDLKDEHVLFPKDVHKSHQNTMKQVKVKSNQILNEKIAKRVNVLNEKYYFEYKNLIIRAAESTEELILEGKTLNHCVASNYTKPYANGTTIILLVRNSIEPEKPYYTVELKNNEIIQIQGKSHCCPNKDVKEFIDKFKEEKLNTRKNKTEKISIPA